MNTDRPRFRNSNDRILYLKKKTVLEQSFIFRNIRSVSFFCLKKNEGQYQAVQD